jgi:hypothetical protein
MALTFNTLLTSVGIHPADVLLVRNGRGKSQPGRSPYEIWLRKNGDYEKWQSIQKLKDKSLFSKPYWATFVSTPSRETLFTGVYKTKFLGLTQQPVPSFTTAGKLYPAALQHQYAILPATELSDLIGKLTITWGGATRAYKQYAARSAKTIHEIRFKFEEPEFPGFLNFNEPLSKIANLHANWVTALKSVKGVYLLVSPAGQQYVGSAIGTNGLYGRWLDYVNTGHGGNVALKRQNTLDFRVSILTYFGSSSQGRDILAIEDLWKKKLGSRVHGLNQN